MLVKLIVTALVIVLNYMLNYILSKIWIFKLTWEKMKERIDWIITKCFDVLIGQKSYAYRRTIQKSNNHIFFCHDDGCDFYPYI